MFSGGETKNKNWRSRGQAHVTEYLTSHNVVLTFQYHFNLDQQELTDKRTPFLLEGLPALQGFPENAKNVPLLKQCEGSWQPVPSEAP